LYNAAALQDIDDIIENCAEDVCLRVDHYVFAEKVGENILNFGKLFVESCRPVRSF